MDRINIPEYELIGKHKSYKNCRFCYSFELDPSLDMGALPLAGGFIEKKYLHTEEESKYPLRLALCRNCKMLQTTDVVFPDTLFRKYYYSTSKTQTLYAHFIDLAQSIDSQLKKHRGFVVEIGSNDGALINELKRRGIDALGIDPAENIVLPQIKKGLPLICDYFSEELAGSILKNRGKADVITSSNTMAHIENINSVYRGIKKLLKKNGQGIIEVHYLKKLLEDTQYDMIYHEHLYYYSVTAMINILKIFKLELFDAEQTSIHAGSIRFFIQHENGPRTISKNVSTLLLEEKRLGIDSYKTFIRFNTRIKKQSKKLVEFLKMTKKESRIVAGYGASGRANTILCYSNINKDLIDYMIDDSKLKQGRYTPGSHLKIIDSKILKTSKRPDFIILFAWAFYNEIVQKNRFYIEKGGKFVIPLPNLKIINE